MRRAVGARTWFGRPGDCRQLRLPYRSSGDLSVVNRDARAGGGSPVQVDREFIVIMRFDLGTFVVVIVFWQTEMRVGKSCCVVMIRIVRVDVRERSLHVGTRNQRRQEGCVCLPQHQNKSSAFRARSAGQLVRLLTRAVH